MVANDLLRVKTDFKYFSKTHKEKWDPHLLVSWSTHLCWWIKAIWVWNLVLKLSLLENRLSHNSCGMWRFEFSWGHWYFMADNGFLKALSFQIAMRSGYCRAKRRYEPPSQWTYCSGANLSWHQLAVLAALNKIHLLESQHGFYKRSSLNFWNDFLLTENVLALKIKRFDSVLNWLSNESEHMTF